MTAPAPTASREMVTTATLESTAAMTSSVQPLRNGQEPEVLAFLAERPLHTFIMTGHIRDNGLESPLNRGRFYAWRNCDGDLEGVALIGHATLLETQSEAALAAFARLTQSCPDAHMIMGEQEKIRCFWKYYARNEQSPPRVCRELLFEQRRSIEAPEPVPDLRLATLADLEPVMLVQGELAFAESGINPVEVDPAGFRARCARRIEQQRVWVWMKDGRLIFKADVISDTPQVSYLEGIYINPQDRGRGFGGRCMSQLTKALLTRTPSVCLFVNERNERAGRLFEQIGFELRSCYETVFLAEKRAAAELKN